MSHIIFNTLYFVTQDTKIASLERNIRDLEDEIQMLKTNGVLNTEDREEEIKQIEVYKSHSKFMKNKVRSIYKRDQGCLNNGKKSLTQPFPMQEAACLLLVKFCCIKISRHEGVKHFG